MRRFLGFAGLSGLGWLLDLAILLTLVGAGALPPFAANVVSSSVAALSVFLVSRRLVFDRDRRHVAARAAIYLVYTLAVILLAAAGLRALVVVLAGLVAASPVVLALAAKVIVTPPQLLLNFAVARLLSERPIGPNHQREAGGPWPTRS